QEIDATGGAPPYVFSAPNPPPGLMLKTLSPTASVLSGTPTTVNTFIFDVMVTDSSKASISKSYQLPVTAGPPLLMVSPLSVDFAGAVNGDSPAPQVIGISALGADPTSFTIAIDGAGIAAAPAWLKVSLLKGVTPARVVVSVDQGNMPEGKYNARIK